MQYSRAISIVVVILLGCSEGSPMVASDAGTHADDGAAPRSDAGSTPERDAATPPPSDAGTPSSDAAISVGPGSNAYFEALLARPELHHRVSLRSQTEIDDNLHGRLQDPPDIVYDADVDGARFYVRGGSGSVAQTVRVEFDVVSSGNLLFYWEGRWGAGFVRDGGIDGLHTQKAYQLARRGRGDNRRIEPRTRFAKADAPFVAEVDTRIYHFVPAIGDHAPLEPQVGDFSIQPETWTRFWALVDFDNDEYSCWIADEDTAPTMIHNRASLDYSNYPNGNEGLDWFWFEHNSSQAREPGTPDLHIWGRNMAVLRDVTDAEVLVSAYVPEG